MANPAGKRIAFVIPHLVGNGAERITAALSRALLAYGYRVDVVLFRARIHYPDIVSDNVRLFVMDKTTDEKTKTDAADVLRRCVYLTDTKSAVSDVIGFARYLKLGIKMKFNPLDLFSWRTYKHFQFVMKYIQEESPDCVLPGLPPAKIATLLAKLSLADRSPPIISVVHNVLSNRRPKNRRRYRLLFPHSERIVAVSDGVRDSVLANTDTAPGNITTIPNFIDSDEINRCKNETPDHPFFADDGVPVILSVGRLHKAKDHTTLIQAFARLIKTTPARLIILGDGNRRAVLEALVRDLGIGSVVSLPGWHKNPFAFMHKANLFVLSSKWEGFGLVLAEALACGCPCVSTDCPSGPADILQNGKVGALVPVGDAAAMAEAMQKTLQNPPPKNALTERAEFFSVEKTAALYDEMIAGLLG